jgi:site-specific DNA recombinase
MKRIGLYLRVSTEEQARIVEGSLVSQQKRLEEYVEGQNIRDLNWGKIVDIYQDDKSAKDMNRPEFQRLLSDVRSGHINLVMATELSRFSRSIKDFCEIADIFKKYGTSYVSLREQFDTTTPAGEMMVFNLINLAQFERQQTSARIAANWLSRAKRGLWNGGTMPLGYDRNPKNPGHLIVNQDEAKNVELIFKTFLQAGAVRKACQALEKSGIRSKAYINKHGIPKGGTTFTVPSLYQILTNRAYIGLREINKKTSPTLQVTKASWEPIINQRLFDEVQKRLSSNKNRYKPNEWKKYSYPLTEKLICGECGKNLGGKSANGQGGVYHYYAHSRQIHSDGKSHLKKCPVEKVRAERTEDTVIKFLKELLASPQKVEEMIQVYQKKSQTELPGLEGKLKTLDHEVRGLRKKQENLMDRISDLPKEVDADLFYKKLKDIAQKLDSVDQQKQSLLVQKTKLSGEMIDKTGFTRRLQNSLAKLEVTSKDNHREVFNNVIDFVEIHATKMRLGIYAPTGSLSALRVHDGTGRTSSTSVKSGAHGQNRTGTPREEPRILSPVRLPIPPHEQ